MRSPNPYDDGVDVNYLMKGKTMEEPKFSLGPWEWANDQVFQLDGNSSVCTVLQRDGVGEWNARLIASAPDLYFALRDALWAIDRLTDPNDALTRGLAALARARGEHQEDF